MCGVVGICHLVGPGPVSRKVIEKMLGAIRHRGPDESGIYLDDWAGLGHNRLSIIDLSSGVQPIHNEDKKLWIVFNGEIFNYLELKEDLLKRGHRFYTETDTEVILHLFEEKGSECLNEFNGQFALAIWDRAEKALFMARDRLGIRPLHYVLHRNQLIFASEIKSLFATDLLKRELDPIAIDQIFTFWTTLGGRTAFNGIHELPPGHCLKAAHGKVSVQGYWNIPFCSPREQFRWPIEGLCEGLWEILHDSIRIRLRSHVPVGCYLSGGLDSSGITTCVKNNFSNTLQTYGIQFEEKAFDETEYQRLMAAFLGTDHTSITATNQDIGASLPEVLWHCEKPLLRTAPVPLFMLSKAVRQNGMKVVLTGEGADEIFGGYQIFRETKVRQFWARRPDSQLRPLLIRRLYPYIFKEPKLEQMLRSFFAKGLTEVDDPFYSHLIRWRNTSRAKVFFSTDLRAAIGSYDGCEELAQTLPEDFSRWDSLARAQYLEMVIFLSNYLLSSQGDRVAMAHSVEIRMPYLDYRLIDFMGRVPSTWKIHGLNEKYILKKVFKETLPPPVIYRPKQPYRAPIRASIFNDRPPYLDEMLSDGCLKQTGLFDSRRIRKLLGKLSSLQHASEVDSMALAGVVSSQLIHHQFVSRFPFQPFEPVVPHVVFDMRSTQKNQPTTG
jgi:asparagine synthase (glutamine-hydrolysing)